MVTVGNIYEAGAYGMLWSITGLIERQKPVVLEISVNHVVNSTLENFSKDRQSGD